jgi:hypothetical protein
LRVGIAASARVPTAGARRGVTAGTRRVIFFFGGVPVFRAVALFVRVGRFGAARRVTVATFRAAALRLVLTLFAALAAGREPRALVAPARVALRRADCADFDAVFRPLVRAVRELFRAAFLVPPAALRLAIACSFSGPHVAAAYLDSYR